MLPTPVRFVSGSLSFFAVLLLATAAVTVRGEPGWPVTVRDALKRTVKIDAVPQRIVSLAPSNTEILFAVGAGDRVVGVTSYCNFPAEAQTRPRVGGFSGSTVNLEALLALRPDLVVAGDEYHRTVIEALTRAGIPTVSIKARDFNGVYGSILTIGRLTDRSPAAAAVVDGLRERVDAVAARVAKIRPVDRLRVYWEVFDAPVITTARSSIIGQLIELAGGLNVFAEIDGEFPQVSTEAVMARDPQVILGPDMAQGDPLTAERVRLRTGWSRIDAVQTGRVHSLSADLTSRPGPRLVDGLELVAHTLYPARFPAEPPR